MTNNSTSIEIEQAIAEAEASVAEIEAKIAVEEDGDALLKLQRKLFDAKSDLDIRKEFKEEIAEAEAAVAAIEAKIAVEEDGDVFLDLLQELSNAECYRDARKQFQAKVLKEIEEERQLQEYLEKTGRTVCVTCPFGNGIGGCTVPKCQFADRHGMPKNVPTSKEWVRRPDYVGD